MPRWILRLLSLVWPVRIWEGQGRHGLLEVRYEEGSPVVNSTHANQSHGSLLRVWRGALNDADIIAAPPRSVLILGYGAGSQERVLRNELGLDPLITAVDDDPCMFQLARDHFGLGVHPRTHACVQDAFTFIDQATDRYDLVLVDLFNDLDVVPEVGADRTLSALRRLTRPDGKAMVNVVVHDPATAAASARIGAGLRQNFSEVRENRYEGNNRVFIAL